MSDSQRVDAPHQGQPIVRAGRPLEEAQGAMILIHGRGASAESILDLAGPLYDERLAYLAPQAANHTWYPNSFLAPIASNEPGISSGLQVIGDLVAHIEDAGIPAEKIIIGGFSQGACLASEFVVRNPRRYGAVLAFSGGVIGPLAIERDDSGDLAGTPVFLGCSDVDFHIPVERVHQTADIFTALSGRVTKKIYPDMGHTIVQDEIDEARKLLESIF